MDEYVNPAVAASPPMAEFPGDVDDLIFLHCPEWNASER